MTARTKAPEAVIVAGGFGTRLLPLTARRPKHLLDVGGVPFLEHQIARLAQAGVRHVVVATSYHADQFEPVLGDGSRWGSASPTCSRTCRSARVAQSAMSPTRSTRIRRVPW
nr:sugar phosphate nucleotidyltransferase [Nocardioides alcanivorans]